VDFQRIAVGDAGPPGEIVGPGDDRRREQHHYNGRRMQQPHRQILCGPSLQVNAAGAPIAFETCHPALNLSAFGGKPEMLGARSK
jgi:hypothetical protein